MPGLPALFWKHSHGNTHINNCSPQISQHLQLKPRGHTLLVPCLTSLCSVHQEGADGRRQLGRGGRGAEDERENSCLMDPIRLSVQSKLKWSRCSGMRPNCCSIFSLSRVLLRPHGAPGHLDQQQNMEPSHSLVKLEGRRPLMRGSFMAGGDGGPGMLMRTALGGRPAWRAASSKEKGASVLRGANVNRG